MTNGRFFPIICFKEEWQSPSPRYVYSSDKIHCDKGNNLKWTVFSGNRPAALVSSGQVRKAGKSDFFLCFFAIFQGQILHCIHLFHKLLYKLSASEMWRQSPKLEQRSASSAFPTAVLLAQSPPASGTNKFTCSYLRELLQLLSPLSCSHRISIICCFFHSIFKYGVSTFLGDSTWSLSFL